MSNYNRYRVVFKLENPESTTADFDKAWRYEKQMLEALDQKYPVMDIMGQVITVGDTVAYSISEDRSALMYLYKVLEVKPDGKLKAQALPMVTRWRMPTNASSLMYPESRCLKVNV